MQLTSRTPAGFNLLVRVILNLKKKIIKFIPFTRFKGSSGGISSKDQPTKNRVATDSREPATEGCASRAGPPLPGSSKTMPNISTQGKPRQVSVHFSLVFT